MRTGYLGTKKGGARKGQPKGARLGYDDTEAIKADRELKPVKTDPRKIGKKGIGKKGRKIPVVKGLKEKDARGRIRYGEHRKHMSVDEGILRLIATHYSTDNVIQAIERLILGKYK